MKLQISFDMNNLEKAIQIAQKVAIFADIIEIGTPLIYSNGINAIKKFRENFFKKELFANLKLVNIIEETIKLYADEGTSYISILAGTNNSTIQNATKIAHKYGCKISLDLLDAYSIGESALNAKALDIDNIIFNVPTKINNADKLLDDWQSVKGNTNLPIFIKSGITRENIDKILSLKPQGIIIGNSITNSENPAKEAEYFKSLL